MAKDKFFGLLRELLTALGTGFAAYGYLNSGIWELITGTLVAVASVIWAFHANEGAETLMTLFRKAFSAVGGLLIGLGWITPEKAQSLAGIFSAALAIFWSWKSKGGTLPPAVPLIALACLLSCSCQPFIADYDLKGEAVFIAEDGAKAGLRWEPGKPVAAFARVAVKDPETGKITGFSYVEIAPKAKPVNPTK
jgi:hypothetical protein